MKTRKAEKTMAFEPSRATFTERIAKASEKKTHKAARRYLRLRTLIEEAGVAIAEAPIPVYSANKFGAKLLKARRLLDRGRDNEVGLMLEDIIDELRRDIQENEHGVATIKKEIRQRFSSACNPHASRSDFRPHTSPRESFKARKYVHVAGSPSPARRTNTTSVLQQARKGLEKLKNGPSRPSAARRSNSSPKQRSRGYVEDRVEDEEEINTLNTLQLTLQILQELPKANLTDHEFGEAEEALKLTKPLLMSHSGCQKLRPFLETLKTSLALHPQRRQPELNMALQGIRIVSYEVAASPRRKASPTKHP